MKRRKNNNAPAEEPVIDCYTSIKHYEMMGSDVLLLTPGRPVEPIRDWKHVTTWQGEPELKEPGETTPKEKYISAVEEVIRRLKRRGGGKTVIARTIAGKFRNIPNPLEILEEMMPRFRTSLCFVFADNNGGYWLAATPELLYSGRRGTLKTRALAGTRRVGDPAPWSEKNIAEHQMVCRDIEDRLANLGIQITGKEQHNMPYADIEHLATEYTVQYENYPNFDEISRTLHPTPAVGGFPRETALADIAELEPITRGYYGGLIDFYDYEGRNSYVILRCIHIKNNRWCLYTGSGITADSDSEEEYRETQAKAAPLLEILSKF